MKIKEILNYDSIRLSAHVLEKKSLVSVIMVINSESKDFLIEKSIYSVLNQNMKNIELIIIYNSYDYKFDKILKVYSDLDNRIKVYVYKNKIDIKFLGFNEGIIKSNGKYLLFLPDGAVLDKNFLNKTIYFMEKNDIKVTHGKSFLVDANNIKTEYGNQYDVNSLCMENKILMSSVIINRIVIEKIGLFDCHVALDGFELWDFLKRAKCHFLFEYTNIYASDEYVDYNIFFYSKDSVFKWIALEHMTTNRNEHLLSSKIGEYDILNFSCKNTDLYIETILKKSKILEKKYFLTSNIYFNLKEDKKNNDVKKRIIVMSNGISASTEVSFLRIEEMYEDFIFDFVTRDNITKESIVFADAFVCLRALDYCKEHIKICKKLNIPVYYYIDDNYMELYKDIKNKKLKSNPVEQESIKSISKEIIDINDKNIDHIFCSTVALKEYFYNNLLLDKTSLFKPIIGKNIFKTANNYNDDFISIAFMGGNFRMKTLEKVVFPAILKLSQKFKIMFYYPSGEKINIPKKFSKDYNLYVECIERSNSLDTILKRYSKKNIDILVHCGPDISNNIYKTENSLLNAVQLGAVLVVSKVEPYKSVKNVNKYVISENSVLDWYNNLEKLSSNLSLRRELYNNAYNYCMDNYNGLHEVNVLKNLLYKHDTSNSYYDYLNRYKNIANPNLEALDNNISNSKSLLNVSLCLSKLIKHKISYKIVCDTHKLSSLGIIFASYGEPKGYVVLKIYENNNLLRESSLDLDYFIRDGWTYLDFREIDNTFNKKFKLEFIFNYDKGSSLVGIFENRKNRSLVYKILNKLGFHMDGINAIYFDCRSS